MHILPKQCVSKFTAASRGLRCYCTPLVCYKCSLESCPVIYLCRWICSVFMFIVKHFVLITDRRLLMHIYSVSQKNPPPPWRLVAIFPKRLGIFQPNFTCLLCVPIYARLRIFIQLPATVTKLYHPVHIMHAKCPPSAEMHAGIFLHISKTVRNF